MFAAPLLASIGTLAGTGAAAASTASIASTALGIGSALVTGVASIMSNNAQSKQLKEQARIADENASRARFRSQTEQQDQDLLARAALGDLASQQAASGLSFGSGSFASRRKAAQILARKDALNIRQGGELEAAAFDQEAADARRQAQLTKRGNLFSMLNMGFDVGSSLVGGASKLNRVKASSITRKAGQVKMGLIS